MSKSLLAERKVLIVMADRAAGEQLQIQIESHLSNCQFVFAANGSEAMTKIENDPPIMVVVDEKVPKTKTEEFVQWILQTRKGIPLAVIWLRAIPENDLFVDDVVTGQLQFFENSAGSAGLSAVLSRAMNHLSAKEGLNEFQLKFLAPQDYLLKRGENARSVYLVKRGDLRAQINKDGADIVLGQISAGEFVGEMAYINGEARTADVIAETDCELIEFPADKLDHMLFQKPSWAKALMMTLSKRLKRANEALKA